MAVRLPIPFVEVSRGIALATMDMECPSITLGAGCRCGAAMAARCRCCGNAGCSVGPTFRNAGACAAAGREGAEQPCSKSTFGGCGCRCSGCGGCDAACIENSVAGLAGGSWGLVGTLAATVRGSPRNCGCCCGCKLVVTSSNFGGTFAETSDVVCGAATSAIGSGGSAAIRILRLAPQSRSPWPTSACCCSAVTLLRGTTGSRVAPLHPPDILVQPCGENDSVCPSAATGVDNVRGIGKSALNISSCMSTRNCCCGPSTLPGLQILFHPMKALAGKW
mmetsp:Transcript_139238/g.277615  ORF Transcript_139238/g.277615 Transcript_139238/m.277615 type:complete len:278 (-) Transcript_139238:1043-1876(-)